jgi:5'-AMP-activated protein kinase catalytic alpha subunit
MSQEDFNLLNSSGCFDILANKYLLVKTLGEGSFGVAKVGIDLKSRIKVAVKIIKKLDAKKEFDEEIQAMEAAQGSPYTLDLLDYGQGKLVDKNKKAKDVLYCVMEYAQNGEFFDYVVEAERFNEKMTRYYYRQLMLGL